MPVSLFISDLHLSDDTPDIEQGLYRFLEREKQVDRLFLLGDIFEAWIGDDDDSALAARFATVMARQASRGTRLYFMRGNRDFLVGQAYLARFGAELLSDRLCLEIAGEPTLLMHGDLLCTDDIDYLAFRELIHDIKWQSEMLAKPLAERRHLAQQLRSMSKEAASNKAEDIMDVNESAVLNELTAQGVSRLIHGHTHRPQRHALPIGERIVLGDWTKTGWCLREQGTRLTLEEFVL